MKIKFDNTYTTNSFFEDVQLLGIVAPIKDYHFCWQVNKSLHFDFRNNTTYEIELLKKERHYYFAVYEYQIVNTCLTHYIYANQFDGEYLLPQYKHLDFLWLIKGDFVSQLELQIIIAQIKSIHQVQLVTVLTNDTIKHREHLVL